MTTYKTTGACSRAISHDVAASWYIGDFETTYADVLAGCEGLLRHLSEGEGEGITP